MRELPLIKYAKRLANQVLASRLCLMSGCSWFGKYFKLVVPDDDTGTEEENRPYYTIVSAALFCQILIIRNLK